jgi:hypothetical protein
MKVLTCSRFFPKGHPKAGQPTHFVEKIEACLADTLPGWELSKTFTLHDWGTYYHCMMPKSHTIRAGNRFKAGEMVSLRVWADKPYRSKQVEFAQVEIKKTWKITREGYLWWLNGQPIISTNLASIAANDGLEYQDFLSWFTHQKNSVFHGQIICWNENIQYQ